MKAGPEVHFLSGQLFTLGITALAVVPRMPSDHQTFSVGGKLSYPFRRALLILVGIGITRILCFHIRPIDSNGVLVSLDAALGTVHVVGESFLCLTTAYLLQCQLINYINIEGGRPGNSLVPYIFIIAFLTIAGSALSHFLNPNWWCLLNLAQGVSCYPVLKTLKTYTSVTYRGSSRSLLRGPVMTQILIVAEFWYLTTCSLSFIAEAIDEIHDDIDKAEGQFFRLLLVAVRQNQDSGVDDWTRLLLHSIFLNSIDELNHVTTNSPSATQTNESSATTTDVSSDMQSLTIARRSRASKSDIPNV